MDTLDNDGDQAWTRELLRGAGLRSTPQRRVILSAFAGGGAEHLSADEVHSRAIGVLPGISRGTVYAALAEFTELGLLAAIGEPEPVRFETNTSRHQHFRCELCLRIFDVDAPPPEAAPFERQGDVRRINVIAEGTCSGCRDYADGLRDGAARIRSQSVSDGLHAHAFACREVATPLGPLLIAGTTHGIARVVFEDHADFDPLRRQAAGGHGVGTGWLNQAEDQLRRYFGGERLTPVCPVDWASITAGPALDMIPDVPYGASRSYHLLGSELDAYELGLVAGANAVPLFLPCHRIRRGGVLCDDFVGGTERRAWLLEHERAIVRNVAA